MRGVTPVRLWRREDRGFESHRIRVKIAYPRRWAIFILERIEDR